MIQADATAAQEPLITTVIPTYRRPALLRRAIESVLGQTVGVARVAVYDNASGDSTGATVMDLARKDPRVRYHAQPANLGPFENFRSGLAGVSTPFFSLLSDDDLLLPGFYETALEALRRHPTALFAATRVLMMDPAGHLLEIQGKAWRVGYHEAPHGLLEMIRLGHLAWTGTLFRGEVIERGGGFDPETAAAFDLDFLLRVAARYPFVICDRIGGVYVMETSNFSLERTIAAWEKMIDNIGRESALSPSQRMQVQTALRQQLRGVVYRIGRAAARRGRVSESQAAAGLLRERFDDRRGARIIEGTAHLCARVPPVRPLLALALRAYRVARSTQLRASVDAADRHFIRTSGVG